MTEAKTGNRVKEKRLQRGWSQAELAFRAGISRTAISAIEGRRLVPSVAAALGLAAALDCTVEALFGPGPRAGGEPVWAWLPCRLPCRYWQARVGERDVLFPAETSPLGMLEHDGVFSGDNSQTTSRFPPEATLAMACCDPAAGLLASLLAQGAGVRLLVFGRSSQESLGLLGKGLIHVAGIHLSTTHVSEGNANAVRQKLAGEYCLLRLAHWQEGVVLGSHVPARSVQSALRTNLRWVGREAGSGARQCLDELLGNRRTPRHLARDHRGVADAIRSGWADAGVCLRLVGEEAGLRFFTVREEVFDLCFAADSVNDPRIQALQRVVRSSTYRKLLGELPGYDASATGELQRV